MEKIFMKCSHCGEKLGVIFKQVNQYKGIYKYHSDCWFLHTKPALKRLGILTMFKGEES